MPAWLARFRRLVICHDRQADARLAFATPGTIIRWISRSAGFVLDTRLQPLPSGSAATWSKMAPAVVTHTSPRRAAIAASASRSARSR